jgi:hypothetical protein
MGMQRDNRIHPRSVLTFTLLVGFLGFQVGSLLQPAETPRTGQLNCHEASELPRLACVSSVTPSDASPLPPLG